MIGYLLVGIGGVGVGLSLAGWCGPREPEASPAFGVGSVLILFAAVWGAFHAIAA